MTAYCHERAGVDTGADYPIIAKDAMNEALLHPVLDNCTGTWVPHRVKRYRCLQFGHGDLDFESDRTSSTTDPGELDDLARHA